MGPKNSTSDGALLRDKSGALSSVPPYKSVLENAACSVAQLRRTGLAALANRPHVGPKNSPCSLHRTSNFADEYLPHRLQLSAITGTQQNAVQACDLASFGPRPGVK
jgi:hypothetical protein